MLNTVMQTERKELRTLQPKGKDVGYLIEMLGYTDKIHPVGNQRLNQCVNQWQQGKTDHSLQMKYEI